MLRLGVRGRHPFVLPFIFTSGFRGFLASPLLGATNPDVGNFCGGSFSRLSRKSRIRVLVCSSTSRATKSVTCKSKAELPHDCVAARHQGAPPSPFTLSLIHSTQGRPKLNKKRSIQTLNQPLPIQAEQSRANATFSPSSSPST